MSQPLTVTGYRFSVYTRAVRMALAAKGVDYAYAECDPFDHAEAGRLAALHPFGRVPVLQHGAFCLWETQAILDYLDAAFAGPALVPEGAVARARMRQVMGITDSYLYWPLVRQAFSHGVFRPLMYEAGDPDAVKAGLDAAPGVLDALEVIAAENEVLVPERLSLADCLLWPMLDYFAMLPVGRRMIAARPGLTRWADAMADSAVARSTKPALPGDEGKGPS